MKKVPSKVVFAVSIFCLLFSLQSMARADCSNPSCVPGPGQVCLFVDANCGGYSKVVYQRTIWWHLTGDNWGNDSLSSFLLGNNTELYICGDWGFGDLCNSFSRDDSVGLNQSQASIPAQYPNGCGVNQVCNDWTSSIRVSPYSYHANTCLSPGNYECSFFTNGLGHGECVTLRVGAYNWGAFGLPNDSIQSVFCGHLASATLYNSGGFTDPISTYVDGPILVGAGTSSLTVNYRSGQDCGGLRSGESLQTNEQVSSCDGRFHLVMQADGNLVLYQGTTGQTMTALWATWTQGTTASFAVMQTDGNFVVYDALYTPYWYTSTSMYPGATLAVQNDGNLVVYANTTPVWASNTAGH